MSYILHTLLLIHALSAIARAIPPPVLVRQAIDSSEGRRETSEIFASKPYCGGNGTYGRKWGHDQYHGWQPHWHWPTGHAGQNRKSNYSFIELPLSAPSYASPPVSSDFIGFAFEEASFPRYVLNSNGTANEYSLNLIDAIMSRTGGKPIIRLGGTSADYARFIPTQQAPALPVAEVYNYQDVGGTSIGPSFWDLTHIVPNSTYIVQLPMAHTNISESILWARTAAEGIGLDRIEAFEPGNEPDLYSSTDPPSPGLVPPAYQGQLTNETYTKTFTEYVSAVHAALDLGDKPLFEAFDTSAHLSKDVLATGYILDVETNFDLGIDAGNNIKTVASHYYQTDGGTSSDLARGLMQHSAIAKRLDLLRKFIMYLQKYHPHIPYILSEVGNSLNPTHDYSYQAVLGSALWAVDFQLYAMSIGIARINWQQIMHAGYDMWLPVDSGNTTRQTFSSFYAMPFVADFIGTTEGTTRAAQLETGHENIVAYAAFVRDEPMRVAIVNMDTWDAVNGARPSKVFALSVPEKYAEVRVDLLDSPEGAHASAETITYAGSQWRAVSEGLEVKRVRNDSRVLTPGRDGRVEIEVYNSQAVLVHIM